MGRGTESEGIEEMAEFFLLFLRADAQHAEHPGLEVFFVNPDGAAAEFIAVQHDVVGHGADLSVVARFQMRNVLGFRAGERMMHRHPCVVFCTEG